MRLDRQSGDSWGGDATRAAEWTAALSISCAEAATGAKNAAATKTPPQTRKNIKTNSPFHPALNFRPQLSGGKGVDEQLGSGSI
jgi:hypothetical protein